MYLVVSAACGPFCEAKKVDPARAGVDQRFIFRSRIITT